jgi:hypothetical protein
MCRFLLVDTGGLLGRTHEWSQDIHKQALGAVSEGNFAFEQCLGDVMEVILYSMEKYYNDLK